MINNAEELFNQVVSFFHNNKAQKFNVSGLLSQLTTLKKQDNLPSMYIVLYEAANNTSKKTKNSLLVFILNALDIPETEIKSLNLDFQIKQKIQPLKIRSASYFTELLASLQNLINELKDKAASLETIPTKPTKKGITVFWRNSNNHDRSSVEKLGLLKEEASSLEQSGSDSKVVTALNQLIKNCIAITSTTDQFLTRTSPNTHALTIQNYYHFCNTIFQFLNSSVISGSTNARNTIGIPLYNFLFGALNISANNENSIGSIKENLKTLLTESLSIEQESETQQALRKLCLT